MRVRIFGLIAVFAAALTASAVMDAAEARRGGGGGGGLARAHAAPRVHAYVGPRSHRGVHYVPVHPRQFHRNYFYSGPRYVRHDRCAWLRHRALATGSRIWWQRYYACRNGIYY